MSDSYQSKPSPLLAVTLFSAFLLAGEAPAAGGETTADFSLQELAGRIVDQGSPTRVYVAREFITMNPNQPRVQAIAVKDGRFTAVGSRDQVVAAAGPSAKIDTTFSDRVVTAGFVEQHVHPVLAALTMNTKVISIEDWDAIDGFSPATRDEQTYMARLKKALAAHPDKRKPFITWGFHQYFHGNGMSRALLDQLAPKLPVIVWHRSCHEFYLNSAALKLVGIDQAFIDGMPASAQQQASLAKGHFFEQGAIAILGKLAPVLASPEQFRKGLEFTEVYYHRNGITLACEPGGFFSKPLQEAINAVYSDDATPFNHCFIADGKTFAARNPADGAALVADTEQVMNWGRGRTFFLPKQTKLLSDGAIYSQLMQMKDGYTDGHHGAWIMDPPLFTHAFQNYWDAGYQIHIHNNGDAGMDVLLDNLEKAMARKPRQDHRTVLVHFGFATPDQVARWGKLGGIISANPYYVTALAGRYAKLGIGPERSENMVPLGDAVKDGISVSFHSDMPMAPAKPLQLVWAGVNRTTFEGPVAGPRHRVSVDLALKAITLDAAYSIRMENKVGSIEVGKDANLTVLDQSPYDVPLDKLKEIRVWGTMLEGRVQPVPGGLKPSGTKPAKVAASAQAKQDAAVTQAAMVHVANLMNHTHDH
ncbi:amidohydrolase [Methylotetracoccus oryzae]|uniref:amidohydrolase n=1 Tax=Methylotetracoccus oryzae TaxID=1919059 RepID=UPI00111853D0|nr:amidohydrolase [Methylotetracoccus oryzae]